MLVLAILEHNTFKGMTETRISLQHLILPLCVPATLTLQLPTHHDHCVQFLFGLKPCAMYSSLCAIAGQCLGTDGHPVCPKCEKTDWP